MPSIKQTVGGSVVALAILAVFAWWASSPDGDAPPLAEAKVGSPRPLAVPIAPSERGQERESPEVRVVEDDNLDTHDPHAEELAAFEEVVDQILAEQPNVSLLTVEWSKNGPIAVFQYQGDNVREVYDSAGERGQFMTLDDFEGDLSDPKSDQAATPPFVALVEIPYGEPLPQESMEAFITIVAGLNPDSRGVSGIHRERSWER